MEKIPENRILQFRPNTLEEARNNADLDKPGRIEQAVAILDKQTHYRRTDFAVNMDDIPKDRILEFRSDTFEEVRRDVDLDKPGRMEEAIDILEDWLQKQTHFVRKDFSRGYLERTLITTKGLIEKAKQRLDKLCTIKTLMPEFFDVTDVSKELAPLSKLLFQALLPKLTPEHYRVFVFRHFAECESKDVHDFYKLVFMLSEYLRHAEYCKGFLVVADLREVNLISLLSKVNPITLAQVVSILIDGYGLRLKGAYVISKSNAVENVLSILKQGLTQKIRDRIQIVKSEEDLYRFVPKEIWPTDYGGQERSLKALNDEWLDVIGSPDNMLRYKEMNKFRTDESCRRTDKFNETYMGMPGSFRNLSVD